MYKLILLFLFSLLHSGESISCYICSSDPDGGGWYDEDCATNGYDGHQGSPALTYGCYTEVYEDGSVERYYDQYLHDDECLYMEDQVNYWRCYCYTDLCNNNNCQQCFNETETTTEGSSIMSTSSSEAMTPITNLPTTIWTEEITTETTITPNPSEGLTCYSCIDCSTVDDGTNFVTDEDFQSCVTAIIGSETMVMRMGDYDIHKDGECVHEDGGIYCYCTTSLCNNGEYNLD